VNTVNTVSQDRPEPSLARAYRWCLKAYPASYRATFGEDIMFALEDSHRGERRPSLRECASLVAAGYRRRLAGARSDKLGAIYAIVLTFESALAVALVAAALTLTADFWSSPAPVGFTRFHSLTFEIGGYAHDAVTLVAYFMALGALAASLGIAAVRAWGRVGAVLPQDGSTPGMAHWSAFDAAVLMAQPIVLFAAALCLAVKLDSGTSGYGAVSEDQGRLSTVLLAGGFLAGWVVIGVMWRRMHDSAPAIRKAGVMALVVAAVPFLAFGVAGGRFGGPGSVTPVEAWAPMIPQATQNPAGSDLATGFTEMRLTATGAVAPFALMCLDPAHCLALGLQYSDPPAKYGALLSTSGEHVSVSPFRATAGTPPAPPGSTSSVICESQSCLFVPAGLAELTCPSAQSCYAMAGSSPNTESFVRSTDGGTSWQQIHVPTNMVRAGVAPDTSARVACMSALDCVFAGAEGLAVSDDGGRSWSSVDLYSSLPTPSGLQQPVTREIFLGGLACPTSRACLAAVEVEGVSRGQLALTTWLLSTRDGGHTWARREVAPLTVGAEVVANNGVVGAQSFDCSTALHCLLVAVPPSPRPAASVKVFVTSNGGATFSVAAAPPAWNLGPDSDLGGAAVMCEHNLTCWAILPGRGVRNLWRSSDGGLSWSQSSPLPEGIAFGVESIHAFGNGGSVSGATISCPTSQACVAVGYRINDEQAAQPNVIVSTLDGGRTWQLASIPDLPAQYRPRPPRVG